MTDDDRHYMVDRGIGITNVVHRATAKASELDAEELRAGGRSPRIRAPHGQTVVAIAGITAYRTAFGHPGGGDGGTGPAVRRGTPVGRAEPERAQCPRDDSTLAEAYATPPAPPGSCEMTIGDTLVAATPQGSVRVAFGVGAVGEVPVDRRAKTALELHRR